MKARRCPFCGRPPGKCWIMPCLELQTLLDRQNERALRRWARNVGGVLQRRKP